MESPTELLAGHTSFTLYRYIYIIYIIIIYTIFVYIYI